MSEHTHAYIGREKCGHVTFATIIDAEHQRETFKDVNAAVRRGLTIEHVTVEDARREFMAYGSEIEHTAKGECVNVADKPKRKKKATAQAELPLVTP